MKKNRWFMFALALCLWFPAVRAQAALHTETVRYKQGDQMLQGYLAYDDRSKAQRPGVLLVHEWWGLTGFAKEKANALAKAGFIAFAVDMYGEGKTTDNPKTAGEWAGAVLGSKALARDRFLAAYEVLRKNSLTRKNHIAAIGFCFGGNVVLTMAQEGVDLKGVVSFHGSLPAEKAAPGSIKPKILICHGADDPLVKPEQVSAYLDNLRSSGADWQFISYGGAKHSFTNPDAAKAGIPGVEYNQNADKRSWQAMLAFFKEVFTK
jgi:dienelactone hydrolase